MFDVFFCCNYIFARLHQTTFKYDILQVLQGGKFVELIYWKRFTIDASCQ